MTRLPFFPEAWLYEPPDWPSLWRLAEGQAGFFTTTEARSKGIRRALLSYHTGRGTFERAGHGPYRLARWPPEPEDRIRIAWMTAGRELAVVSHESALFIHGLIDEPPAWVDLTVPRERRRRIPSREVQWGRRVLVHAPRRGLAAGEVTVARGIRAEAAERALVDVLRRGWTEVDVARAVDRGATTWESLSAAVAALRGPRSATARRALRSHRG